METAIPCNYGLNGVGRVAAGGDGSTLAGFRAYDAVVNDQLTQGQAGEKFGCSQQAISQRIQNYQRATGNTEPILYRRPGRKKDAMTKRQRQMVQEFSRLQQVRDKRKAKLDANPDDFHRRLSLIDISQRVAKYGEVLESLGIKN